MTSPVISPATTHPPAAPTVGVIQLPRVPGLFMLNDVAGDGQPALVAADWPVLIDIESNSIDLLPKIDDWLGDGSSRWHDAAGATRRHEAIDAMVMRL